MAKECSCSDELSDQPCPSHGELFSPTDEEADALGLPRIPKQVWFSIGGADISLGSIKAALGLAGLHVVTADEVSLLRHIQSEITVCESEISQRDPEDEVHIQADGYRHIRSKFKDCSTILSDNTESTKCSARAANGKHYPDDCGWCGEKANK